MSLSTRESAHNVFGYADHSHYAAKAVLPYIQFVCPGQCSKLKQLFYYGSFTSLVHIFYCLNRRVMRTRMYLDTGLFLCRHITFKTHLPTSWLSKYIAKCHYAKLCIRVTQIT